MTQSFEDFLAEWRKHALPTVVGRELDAVLEDRARELAELAVSKGFRIQLSRAIRPYRSTKEFVRALHDASHHHQKKQTGKDGSQGTG
jgi:propanediol dehydratase small subunit